MPVSILVLALVLLVTGLSTALLGLSLTPTDMGRVWLDIGFTVATGGIITLAIGFATRALCAALEAGPRVAASPAPLAAAPAEPETATSSPLGLPVVVAAGGAAVAAGVALGADHLTARTAPAPMDELEKDLFADIHAQIEAPLVAPEPLPEAPGPLPADAPETPEPAPAPVDEASAGFELRLTPEPETLAPPEPAPEQPAPALETPAGLIADEDLAALVAEEPPLAALETLEVVGAYDSAGVRFTMYSDGSVNAVAPQGERRYRSLEALRKQLDSGLPAV